MWVDLDPDLYKYSKEIKISLGKKKQKQKHPDKQKYHELQCVEMY